MPCCKTCNDLQQGCKDDSNSDNELCCCCNNQVKAKFGLAWIAELPNCTCREPLGWQVEFIGTPSNVKLKCDEMVAWVNCPPLPNKDILPLKCICNQQNEGNKKCCCNTQTSFGDSCCCSPPPTCCNCSTKKKSCNCDKQQNSQTCPECCCQKPKTQCCCCDKKKVCKKCKQCKPSEEPSENYKFYCCPPDILSMCPPQPQKCPGCEFCCNNAPQDCRCNNVSQDCRCNIVSPAFCNPCTKTNIKRSKSQPISCPALLSDTKCPTNCRSLKAVEHQGTRNANTSTYQNEATFTENSELQQTEWNSPFNTNNQNNTPYEVEYPVKDTYQQNTEINSANDVEIIEKVSDISAPKPNTSKSTPSYIQQPKTGTYDANCDNKCLQYDSYPTQVNYANQSKCNCYCFDYSDANQSKFDSMQQAENKCPFPLQNCLEVTTRSCSSGKLREFQKSANHKPAKRTQTKKRNCKGKGLPKLRTGHPQISPSNESEGLVKNIKSQRTADDKPPEEAKRNNLLGNKFELDSSKEISEFCCENTFPVPRPSKQINRFASNKTSKRHATSAPSFTNCRGNEDRNHKSKTTEKTVTINERRNTCSKIIKKRKWLVADIADYIGTTMKSYF